MLKVYDQNHEPVGNLIRYRDLKLESELTTGDKKLTFKVSGTPDVPIHGQYFIRTRSDEFVVKNIGNNSKRKDVPYTAVLNLEDLVGNPFASFSIYEQSMKEGMEMALEGTPWTLGECDIPDDDVRNGGLINCDSLAAINALCTIWMAEPEFDTLNKKVHIRKQRGSDKGVYFMAGLNLRNVEREENCDDFYTVLIPIGADDLDISEVNDGLNYITDFSYSRIWKAYRWIDESYDDPQKLKDDGLEYLKELAHPRVSMKCDVIDLAKQNSLYSVLAYQLGDYVTIIDPGTRVREKQRITKLIEYPATPWKNECEMANHQPRFTEMLEKRKKAHDIEVFEGGGDIISLSQILRELRKNNQ